MFDHIKEKTAIKDRLAKIESELQAVHKKGDLSKINLESFEKALLQLKEDVAKLQEAVSKKNDEQRQALKATLKAIAIEANNRVGKQGQIDLVDAEGELGVILQAELEALQAKESSLIKTRNDQSKLVSETTIVLNTLIAQLGQVIKCQQTIDALKPVSAAYQGAKLNHLNTILEHPDMKKISASAKSLAAYSAKQLKSTASIDKSKGQLAQNLAARIQLVMSVVNDKKISSDKKVELLAGLKNEVDAAINENQRAVREYDIKRVGVTLTDLLSATLRSENLDKELKSLSSVLVEVTRPYEKLVALKQTLIVANRPTISVTPVPPAQQEAPRPSK